jgi:hypothetical protein
MKFFKKLLIRFTTFFNRLAEASEEKRLKEEIIAKLSSLPPAERARAIHDVQDFIENELPGLIEKWRKEENATQPSSIPSKR